MASKVQARDASLPAIKIVVIGDAFVGKTCLLIVMTTNAFPSIYLPTVLDDSEHNVELDDGQQLIIRLLDTAGGEDYDRLRPLSYPQTDVFLLCFSIASQTSLQHVKTKWWPEVTRDVPNAQKILIEKLRQKNQQCVTPEEAEAMAEEIGACCYIETSSLAGAGIRDLLHTMGKIGLQHQRGEKIVVKKPRKDASRMTNRCVAM